MHPKNQARISLRVKMTKKDITFRQLATQVGHPRSTVSKAVNHGRFPRVLKKIKDALDE